MKNTATAAHPSEAWEAALRRFERDLRRRGAGRRTRRSYAADVIELATWAVAQGLEPEAVTERLLRAYAGRLADRRLASARAFFRSMVEHGEMAANPADLLPAPEPARMPVRIPAVTPLELRDRALFELARAGRLSAEQLVNLDLGSVDVADDRATRAALTAYLERGRPALAGAAGDPALFLSKSGLRLSTSDVRRRLRAWGRRTAATHGCTRIESARLRAAYLHSHPRA